MKFFGGMRSRRAIVLIVILALLAMPWFLREFATRKVEVSYRLTVTADVDGESRQSSGVIHEVQMFAPRWLGGSVQTGVEGDAVFLDLGRRGHVIAILATERNGELIGIEGLGTGAFNVRARGLESKTAAEHRVPAPGASAELSAPLLPVFVTFADLNNPKTARVVQPQAFPQVFGEGVRLQRVSIEITNAPVTRHIERQLPWLRDYRTSYLHGKPSCTANDLPCLQGSHFTRG